MNEINKTAGFNNTLQTTSRALSSKDAEEKAEAPRDEVNISKPEPSLARKIISFPGKAMGKVAGVITGTVSAPLHVLPGAAKGIMEGLDVKGTGAFHFVQWAQNLAIGAGAGMMMGGPIGAAIGAGAAAIFSGVNSFVGHKSGSYSQMMKEVKTSVEKANADNTGPRMKVAVQNMTEGALIGGAAAAKSGWDVGRQAGEGIVQGVFGTVEGLGEGIIEAGKSIFSGKKE